MNLLWKYFLHIGVDICVQALKERRGSSRRAILKYIMANFNVGSDPKVVNVYLKSALKRGTESGIYKQLNGTGAAGRFKMGEKRIDKTKKVRRAGKLYDLCILLKIF